MKLFNRRQLTFECSRIRQMPLSMLVRKATAKMFGLALGILLLPLTALMHLAGFRHVSIFTDRIGHLAMEPDCLLKEQELGLIPRRKWVLLAPEHRVANVHLLSYLEPYFFIIRNRTACFVVQSMTRWGLAYFDVAHYMRAIGQTQASYRIYREWGERPPIQHLSKEDIAWGFEQLAALGVPKNTWFVCLHVREGGFSPVDEELHRHRNADLRNTFLAVEDIVQRGGWVIRLGDPTMKSMPQMPQTIDYAHHSLKSARLDVFLCTCSRFILGNTSGIALIGTIFGVPSALTNMVPITAMGFGLHDISIPKLFWSSALKRHLSLQELIGQGLGSAQFYSQFVEADIQAEENSAQDILDLSIEMFDYLEGLNSFHTLGEILQSQFTGTFRDGDYAFMTHSKVGARFLLKHHETLGFKITKKTF